MGDFLEKNIKIAKMLGNDTSEYGFDVFVPNKMLTIEDDKGRLHKQGIFEFSELEFHKSYEWMMYAVDFIERIVLDHKGENVSYTIDFCHSSTAIYKYDLSSKPKKVVHIEVGERKEHLYNAIVGFAEFLENEINSQ